MKFKLSRVSDMKTEINIEINTIEDLEKIANETLGISDWFLRERDQLIIDFDRKRILIYDDYIE